jgi:hypothetical protein
MQLQLHVERDSVTTRDQVTKASDHCAVTDGQLLQVKLTELQCSASSQGVQGLLTRVHRVQIISVGHGGIQCLQQWSLRQCMTSCKQPEILA